MILVIKSIIMQNDHCPQWS